MREILDLAGTLKKAHAEGKAADLFAGKTLVMIFEKPSTRTRVSFQVAMQQLGGHVVVMSEGESQLGRGETIADTARVLSRYADAIMIRTDDPQKLDDLEAHATVPVINGLSDDLHPCQLMADMQTFHEHRGSIAGKTVAWIGDGKKRSPSSRAWAGPPGATRPGIGPIPLPLPRAPFAPPGSPFPTAPPRRISIPSSLPERAPSRWCS